MTMVTTTTRDIILNNETNELQNYEKGISSETGTETRNETEKQNQH